jgi:predicted tellurium resistance membrane protein TerC
MKQLKFLFLTVLMIAISIISHAQDDKKVEMADTMRSNGRIYVVIAVIVTILIGLILYLVRLDRKIGRIEKEVK